MIIVKITSGLGNQMFQYAIGRSLSLLRGTELVLDLDWYKTPTTETKRDYELVLFNISAKPLEGRFGSCFRQLRRRRYSLLRTLLRAIRSPLAPKHICDLQDGFDDRPNKAGPNVYLEGYWQCGGYFSAIREVLLKDFTFAHVPDSVNSAMLASISNDHAVCVHVRRGDYTTAIGQDVHGVCDLKYYKAAMEYIQDRVAKPHFFVFSDDPQWVRDEFYESPNLTVVSHNVGVKDYEDLRLMMNCKYFIIANSSFSWWAAWLGQSQDKIVIAPKRWFATDKLSGKDLVPADWIRL